MAVESPPQTQRKDVSFHVTGMTCASCVRRVEKALKRVEGVDDASVNLATEKATVVFDPAVVEADSLSAAVEKAGYGITPIEPSRAETAQPLVDPLVEERVREIFGLGGRKR